MDADAEAERIRSLVMLLATCETVLERLNADEIDDLALSVQIGELGESIGKELEKFARRGGAQASVGGPGVGVGEELPEGVTKLAPRQVADRDVLDDLSDARANRDPDVS